MIHNKTIKVDESQAGQRIDNCLIKLLKGVPKSHIYRLLRKGTIRVNKKRAKPHYKLQEADIIGLPDVRIAEREKLQPNQKNIEFLRQRILYENDDLLIINKPTGVAVHGGSGVGFGVIDIFRAMRPDAKFIELVHRLDRDTSGCLLLAKRRSVLKELHELWRAEEIKKSYFALLRGRWQGQKRIVDVALDVNNKRGQERFVKVKTDGKKAVSEFIVKQKFAIASLMEVILHTGRTHQIRVHAAYLGCPIVGDSKYGDSDFNKMMRKFGVKRLFLHAHCLQFVYDGKKIDIKAPLDDDLEKVLAALKAG